MRPLISVMVPCFNSAETVQLALGSLAAQTVSDWEAVCIDDGSKDTTWSVLEDAARRDKRIKIERTVENRGRGWARQRALELATGKYLAFCDSDDWLYPGRLACQLRWFEADRHIMAVSVCAAITNGSTELVGVLRPQVDHPLPAVRMFEKPVPPPILFPSSMVDTALAKATGFDPEFRRSQDSDFLMRALLGKHYALASEVLYGYSQGTAASLERTLEGYRYRMRAHARHWREHPARVTRTIAETGVKMLAYRVAGALGKDKALIERRWNSEVDETTSREFQIALGAVQAATERLFGN